MTTDYSFKTFNITDPLPQPATTLALEASAGTGKTYNIAALALRFIAETDLKIDQLMVVTFSRAAANELKSRIFERLRLAAKDLQAEIQNRLSGANSSNNLLNQDSVVCAWTGEDSEQLGIKLARINQAIAEIDLAMIATTHEFCSRMLAELGVLVDHAHTDKLAADTKRLANQIIVDQYLADNLTGQTDIAFTTAEKIGHAALSHPNYPLYPKQYRAEFGEKIRGRFAKAKKDRAILTFDDIILRLESALTDPATADLAASRLSQKFPVVLIDEFQDTDPSQWKIIEKAFHNRSQVVLIGDPKQSIYLFRNADISSYFAAVDKADQRRQLSTNYRSDKKIVDAVTQLFSGVDLGNQQQVHPVEANIGSGRIRLARSEVSDSSAMVDVGNDGELVGVQIRNLTPRSPQATLHIDVANTVVKLLNDGYEIFENGSWRPLAAQDIAVLCHANRDAESIHKAILAANVNSVYFGHQSVYTTRAGQDWLSLLSALAEQTSETISRALMTKIIDCQLAKDLSIAESRMAGAAIISRLASSLATQGVASVLTSLTQNGAIFNLLDTEDGLRYLTDLRHLADLSNQQQTSYQLSPNQLVAWLRDQIETSHSADEKESLRRLDSAQKAVTVRTLHSAKGLQYPVVLLPSAGKNRIWPLKRLNGSEIGSITTVANQRVIEVGGDGSSNVFGRLAISNQMRREEDLRLLYVGFTRAESLAIAWWHNHKESSLASLLYSQNIGESASQSRIPADSPNNQNTGLSADLVRFKEVSATVTPLKAADVAVAEVPLLSAAKFNNTIDYRYGRTSYSGLTAESHQVGIAAGIDIVSPGKEDDEPVDELLADQLGQPAADVAEEQLSLLADVSGGTGFGSLVHAILEILDFSAPNRWQLIEDQLSSLVSQYRVENLDLNQLKIAIDAVIATDLGLLTGGRSLADLGISNRLAELDFEIPLGEKASGNTSNTVAKIADLLQDTSLVPASDPLSHYGKYLADSPAAVKHLRGFLTGSIDAVLQVAEPGKPVRYVVVDYKTNRVPLTSRRPLKISDYRLNQMVKLMCESHYPLQALIYSAALHRFLTNRLPGYRPEDNLGGVGYLFVRGMAGKDSEIIDGTTSGVMQWYPKAELVVGVSKVLAGENHG